LLVSGEEEDCAAAFGKQIKTKAQASQTKETFLGLRFMGMQAPIGDI
jgi:hypothetical protein